jgi:hypothetical protein
MARPSCQQVADLVGVGEQNGQVGVDLGEHLGQLRDSFASAEADRERIRGFIQLFVRPYGRDVAATPRVVQAIEEQAAIRPAPVQMPGRMRALQSLLRALVTTAAAPRAAAQATKR